MIALEPNNAIPYGLRGGAYRRKEQYNKAIEDYTKAISLDPNPNRAGIYYTNRAAAYWKMGDKNRAITDYQKGCDLGNEYGCKGLEWALKNR
ncbi:MAG: tetratricopeptide repeat protein [Nitrospirae bacterium]|nr:tetratricopeptide repeat protein [Nitrospirota bacterium]